MKTALLSLFLGMLTAIVSEGADWKFYGGATLAKGDEVYSFFDSQGVKHLDRGMVEVWTKSVDIKEIDRVQKKRNKEIVERSAEKVVAGYVSPYARVTPAINSDGDINVISWEETANISDVTPRAKFLYEIDCDKSMIRILSASIYKKGILSGSSDTGSDWKHISPESSAESLKKILCDSPK